MSRRDQGLAVTAWTLVESVPEQQRQQFRTRAMGLGAMLQTCGLAATAAFLAAKSGENGTLAAAYRRLSNALEQYVLDSVGVAAAERASFLLWLGKADSVTYRRASAVARDFGTWVRRAAEALIPEAGAAATERSGGTAEGTKGSGGTKDET